MVRDPVCGMEVDESEARHMFIVMSGYGLTLTVLPFYIGRMALGGGATSKEISVHVGALTGVFALMQFFFAPSRLPG